MIMPWAIHFACNSSRPKPHLTHASTSPSMLIPGIYQTKIPQTLFSYSFASFKRYNSHMASFQIIRAPSEEPIKGTRSVFLAGTTTNVDKEDWREKLSASLSSYPIIVFNPNRPDWDSTWREDINFAPYREQVTWELDKQLAADLLVVHFHPSTMAPISLLEFGLSARESGKVIAVAPQGYAKRGNVQIVCQRFGIEFLDDVDQLHGAIVKKLGLNA